MNHPDQIPAGRELDKLMAAKVMGWETIEDEQPEQEAKFPCVLWDDGCGVWFKYADQGTRRAVWSPSTDMEDALVAADHLRRAGAEIVLELGDLLNVEHSWVRAEVRTSKGSFLAGAPDAALALCRAILKAVTA